MQLVRSLRLGGWVRICASVFCLSLTGPAMLGVSATRADASLEVRKLPMTFTWHEASNTCDRDCNGWVAAVGIITADTPAKFDEFSKQRKLRGSTVVLDSSGGSVLDAITLGRRWRELGLRTTVGTIVEKTDTGNSRRTITPDAYCESMCVFLLLSGNTRHVPAGAHVRVHQIWMGDRADDAKASSYSAQDLMIVQRDVGRLAKYTFDMGGSGDLLSLALSVPPWEPLHELSTAELRLTNLITTDAVAEVKAVPDVKSGAAEVASKPVQDRFVSAVDTSAKNTQLNPLPTKTATAEPPTGGAAPANVDRK
ncbi:hypothetical protein [Bradyrhizobium sp. SYSU BS000235]|uniref:COG3904 family protein n=1 Tax=Bradyrhizobium sp. SYSU BS000235 TaxID=3411332 RepID=UPI003C738976